MPDPTLSLRVSARLHQAATTLAASRALVGFDGFVDTILHVVRRRLTPTEYERETRMVDFAARISAAAGLSANMELVAQMVKLGGNGPIMANALGAYGLPVTYMGNLGRPALHPVFDELAGRATVYSLAEPGYTDAYEFDDGKLMFGKHASLQEVNWATLLAYVPLELLTRIIQESALLSIVNWTMLTHMGGIWEGLLTQVAPALTGPKRWLFFDLADPAKRSAEDLLGALRQISSFQAYFRVILGLNLQEARQVGSVLGLPAPADEHAAVTEHARAVQAELGVETVVIHPAHFAAAADAHGAAVVAGPYTAKPKITTGAGDHFNAGFCVGRLLDLPLAESLQVGVATSGFYVRQAASPTLADLQLFLAELGAEAPIPTYA